MKNTNTIWKPAAAFHKASSLCHSLVRLVINWAFKTIYVVGTSALILPIGILLCFYSCKNGKKRINSSSNNFADSTTQSLEQRLTDSLFRYIHLTEFVQRGEVSLDTNYVLYGKEVNKNKIGIVAIEGKKLLLFQNINNKFLLTDSFAFNNYAYSFNIDDLNGDNKDDFIIYGFPNMHGQSVPYVFLSDSNYILHYRSDVSLFNISYDFNKKLIRTFYVGGARSIHSKELYCWVNDSLEFVNGAELDLSNPNYIETRLYKMQNGKQVYYKKLRNDEGAFYNQALFDIIE